MAWNEWAHPSRGQKRAWGWTPRNSKAQSLEEEEPATPFGVVGKAEGKTRPEGSTVEAKQGQSVTSSAAKGQSDMGTKKGSTGFGNKIFKDLGKNRLSTEMSAEALFE